MFSNLAPHILSAFLLLANVGVLATFYQDRQSFKSEVKDDMFKNKEELKEYFDVKYKELEKIFNSQYLSFIHEHTDPDKSLHMSLKDKLTVFTPRQVSDERYEVLSKQVAEANARLSRIEEALSINAPK